MSILKQKALTFLNVWKFIKKVSIEIVLLWMLYLYSLELTNQVADPAEK